MGVLNSDRARRRALWVAGFTLWGVALAGGFHQAMSWEFKPGSGATPPQGAPKPSEHATLIVALHSQCPCSIATVANLTKLDDEDRRRLRITFVLTGPDVRHSPILDKVSGFRGAEVLFLSEEEVLKRYGARTSGQALLYDSSGHLLFSGGLTDSRGTPGESAGMQAIYDTLAGRRCISTAPVYGCSLQTPR